jgi:bilirubin oxidase
MDRRRFLGGTLGMSALLAGPARDGCAQMLMAQRPLAGAGLEGLPLRRLPVLANESHGPDFAATLAAAPESPVPGIWRYNGSSPGPTIELWEGQHARLRFENRLPQDSTVHWHGLAVPSDQDGNPMDPVRPGETRLYEFHVPAGSAGTYWYHPHAHGTTLEQVARGLAGPMIVRARDDALGHIAEQTLFVTDGHFDATGGGLRVNGLLRPVHATAPGATERWRIVNATAGRYFRIALEEHEFTLVGTDGGALAAPIEGLREILLAPAQRVEVIVNVRPFPGASYRLLALAHRPGAMAMPVSRSESLLVLAAGTGRIEAPIPIPATLRAIEALAPTGTPQRVELGERLAMGGGMGAGMMSRFLINGRTFDMDRVDLVSVQGRVERWDIVNRTSMDHPIHIHGTQFQLLGRESAGVATPAPYRAWIDTVNVPPGQSASIAVRHALPGKRMFHCHILAHEDAGMMGVLDVRPA